MLKSSRNAEASLVAFLRGGVLRRPRPAFMFSYILIVILCMVSGWQIPLSLSRGCVAAAALQPGTVLKRGRRAF